MSVRPFIYKLCALIAEEDYAIDHSGYNSTFKFTLSEDLKVSLSYSYYYTVLEFEYTLYLGYDREELSADEQKVITQAFAAVNSAARAKGEAEQAQRKLSTISRLMAYVGGKKPAA